MHTIPAVKRKRARQLKSSAMLVVFAAGILLISFVFFGVVGT